MNTEIRLLAVRWEIGREMSNRTCRILIFKNSNKTEKYIKLEKKKLERKKKREEEKEAREDAKEANERRWTLKDADKITDL